MFPLMDCVRYKQVVSAVRIEVVVLPFYGGVLSMSCVLSWWF